MKTEDIRIILASKSPRRKELLESVYEKVEIIPSDADENINENDPCETVRKLSYIKAKSVYDLKKDSLRPGDYVLGSDTVVYAGKEILGKPNDRDDAKRMIKELSGKVHSVFTGFTLIDHKGAVTTDHCETKVFVYEMSENEIEEYINTDEPYDKAGAYGIQGIFGRYVEKIEGDYNNVVGLPVSKIYNTLNRLEKSL